jgi:hypothetical protein
MTVILIRSCSCDHRRSRKNRREDQLKRVKRETRDPWWMIDEAWTSVLMIGRAKKRTVENGKTDCEAEMTKYNCCDSTWREEKQASANRPKRIEMKIEEISSLAETIQVCLLNLGSSVYDKQTFMNRAMVSLLTRLCGRSCGSPFHSLRSFHFSSVATGSDHKIWWPSSFGHSSICSSPHFARSFHHSLPDTLH